MCLYVLENDKLKIEISSHGAELFSVKRKADSREYLWQGDPAFWGRRSPVLFPVVGKYKDLKTRYEERNTGSVSTALQGTANLRFRKKRKRVFPLSF